MIDLPILPAERARLEALDAKVRKLKAKVRKLKQQRDVARSCMPTGLDVAAAWSALKGAGYARETLAESVRTLLTTVEVLAEEAEEAKAALAAIEGSDGDMVEAWAELEGSPYKRETMADSVSGILNALEEEDGNATCRCAITWAVAFALAMSSGCTAEEAAARAVVSAGGGET